MLNTKLLSPENILMIALISTVIHMFASPLYHIVGKPQG